MQSGDTDEESAAHEEEAVSRRMPCIDGFYGFPALLDEGIADTVIAAIAQDNVFNGGKRDQVMLFGRAPDVSTRHDRTSLPDQNGMDRMLKRDHKLPNPFPAYLQDLLFHLSTLLRPLVPSHIHDLIFSQPLARQIILNLYPSGTGIAPHVDLPNRYADGILGVSLLGPCTMELESDVGEVERVYMPRGTVYVLTGEARWEWSHGIRPRREDLVWDDEVEQGIRGRGEDDAGGHGARSQNSGTMSARRNQNTRKARTIVRGTRLSVTFRWMKSGADLLT